MERKTAREGSEWTLVMDTASIGDAIEWQAQHAERNGAPCTARVVRGLLKVAEGNTATGQRIANWQGLSLRDAMPLRITGGLHHLLVSGQDRRLEPVYAGLITDQAQVDAIVAELVETYDTQLLPWLDHPPQTNEAGRSASFIGALLWLSQRLGSKFEMNEVGASSGVNTMIERYFYDLGGVRVGPENSPMRIAPDWRGDAPPSAEIDILAIKGCDVTPINLADPEQALKLKSYVWPDAVERMARIDAAIALASEKAPDLVAQDAADFVDDVLAEEQREGVTRVLYHSIVWQYLPDETQARITAAMDKAGVSSSADKPLAWIKLETNRETFRHELLVRYWAGDEVRDWVQLGEAHPHGAWVEWMG